MVEELGDGEQVFVMEKKSCEMSPGETESSGSAPPHSERYFDDQEVLRASLRCQSPNDDSHNHVLQSPEISSNNDENEDHETVKSLSEKLSAALLNISAKEDLVKQHSKVAEEAVSGWEKAETEVAALKQQLDVATQKNSALEDRINHLDGALKECVRQLRQSKEEHEQKVRDAVIRKTQEWESNKSKLENQLIELRTQLEASKGEAEKLETIEKENAALKGKLLALSEELEIQRIESELSTKTAETASKQHLESIKKVAKLEAECRKLRATARKTPSTFNDPKATSSSACVESLTDSQSDNCSDSWASALIAELDQFKNEKTGAKVVASSVDIDLMDDFLEMERLAAMPEADHGSSSFVLEADGTSKDEDGDEKLKMAQLEEKVEILENEKAKLYMALADCQNQLTVAEGKLVSVEVKRKALESQLELTLLEAEKLRDMVASLEEGNVEESAYSSELKARLEASEERRVAFESQAHLAYLEVEKLREKVILLESRVEEERTLTAELASKLDSMEKMKEKVSLLEAMEGEKQVLELELELAESKVQRLNEERTLSAELASKSDSMEKMKEKVSLLEAMEGEKQVLELGLELAESEVQRLNDEMRTLSAELASKLDSMEKMKEMVSLLEAMEGEKKALELELELEQSEVQRLNDEMSLLEQKFDRERALSKQFAERCQNLEDELSRKKREAELRVVSCSNGDLTAKQEKELAVAAEKLAECQRTIASLGQQLKSLMKLDDIMFESEKLDLNGKCKGVKH